MSIHPSWKVGLSLVAIFVAGAAVGSLLTIAVIRGKVRQADQDASRLAQAVMQRMESELKLTAAQSEKIRPIVEHAGEQFRGLQVLAMARIRRILQDVDHKVSEHLTAEQRTQLNRLVQERQERWRRFLGRELPDAPKGPPDVTR
ncbi:MAG: hypothetical protein IT577_23620 [Verrucomicrobiae bacterium]|nr:hypothetical protein [Verrucomicrobiae bacterium]